MSEEFGCAKQLDTRKRGPNEWKLIARKDTKKDDKEWDDQYKDCQREQKKETMKSETKDKAS